MLVALGVMIVAMTVVATVFSLTTRTAATSTGLAEAQTLLRAFTQQIEQDLAGVDPRNSVLVIVGRTQQASLTADDIAAERYLRTLVGDPNQVQGAYQDRSAYEKTPEPNGPDGFAEYSDPRADILMFFTQRPLASEAPPPDLNPAGPANQNYPFLIGAKMSPSQIVYGHAAIDQAEPVGSSTPPTYRFADRLKHIRPTSGAGPSELPITRWVLGRRQGIIRNVTAPSNPKYAFTPQEFDRLVRCYSDPTNSPNDPGDAASLDLTAFFNEFGTKPSGGVEPAIIDRSPYRFDASPDWTNGRNRILGAGNSGGILYHPSTQRELRHVATVVEDPPANLRSNLAIQALLACGWFQVEFLMPEDPRNARDYYDNRATGPRNLRGDMPRWTHVPNNQTYVFVPDTDANRRLVASQVDLNGKSPPSAPPPPPPSRLLRSDDFAVAPPPTTPSPYPMADRKIRMWPYAIRITVRVYDRLNRFTEPLERTIVHRFD